MKFVLFYYKIEFYKRENFRLEDEVISLQKRASETQLVQSDLEFYKRLYHTNLRTVQYNLT